LGHGPRTLAALRFLYPCPSATFLGPLVVWLAKRDHSAFVALHAKEALNFNITFLIGALVCGVLLVFSIGILFGAVLFCVLAGHDHHRRA